MTRLVVPTAVLLVSAPGCTDHVDTAAEWVAAVDPINNSYGGPADITWTGTEPTITSKCGSFLGLLFKETYAGITDDVLEALTGSASPYAVNWYDAIVGAASADGYSFEEMHGDTFDTGDLLVTAWGEPGTLDHAMLVDAVAPAPADAKAGPTGTYTSLLVTIYDASQTPHGSQTTPFDTRYQRPDVGSIKDEGIGQGQILVYVDVTGEIIGWRWSLIDSTLYVQVADGVNAYRPLVAGRLAGGEILDLSAL